MDTISILINSIGWIGSLLVVGAYALNSYQKISSSSSVFQLMNFVGAVLLIINSFYKEAYPFTFINSVWVLVAVGAMVRKRK